MNINIIVDGKTINVGGGYPISALWGYDEKTPGRTHCCLFSGSASETIEGTSVWLQGSEYVIGHRRYDLSSGFVLAATLTPKFTIIPRLRLAVGKEIEILRDKNGNPINHFWPILKQIGNSN